MDLKEAGHDNVTRHPWETSRLRALRNILSPTMFDGMTVLDVGCGDGFVASNLFDQKTGRITAVDTNLTDAWLATPAAGKSGITFTRELSGGAYDLVLLLDVLEHVADDKAMLQGVVEAHLKGGGCAMITVPAFNAIYSGHDAFLGHYRRYSLDGLVHLASEAGLHVRRSGYLFSSLLLPKLLLYKVLKSPACSEGVGNWRRGALVTALVEAILNLDNAFLLVLGRLGIKVPGLTGWVLCEKRG